MGLRPGYSSSSHRDESPGPLMKIVERRQKKVETQDPQSKLKSGRSVTKGLVNLILVAKAHTLSCEQCTNGVDLLVC